MKNREICPYCSREFKRITTNHLKTHNITWLDYLRSYSSEKYYEERLFKFIWEYYQPATKRFIEQVEEMGSKGQNQYKYKWITVKTISKTYRDDQIKTIIKDPGQTRESRERTISHLMSKRPFPFCKTDIIKHIRKEKTVGIYCKNEQTNCFLIFDIDIDDLYIVEKIWETLNKFGIRDEQILVSWSGNKGYHVSIYFDDEVSKVAIKQFFDIIIREANLEKLKRANGAPEIECRGASAQGVKIPFSLNRKNTTSYIKVETYDDYEKRQQDGVGNLCFLINKYGGEIDTLSKIESMKKIDANLIKEIVEDYTEELIFENDIDISENEFEGLIEDVDIGALANSKEDMMNSIKRLLTMPIQPKSRHNTLLKVAIYNKSRGFTLEENKEFLNEFSYERQTQFETSMKDNIREIEAMLDTIYNSPTAFKYKIAATPQNIYFSKEDILEILSLKNKALQKMYFLMILHFKLYANSPDGEFYLGYDRMRKALGVNEGVISKRLQKLNELGKIEFVRKGERGKFMTIDEKKVRYKKYNIYKLNYKIKYVETGYKLLCNPKSNGDNITYVNFQMMCSKALTKKEIAEHCKDKKDIIKFKYQPLREIG